MAKYTLLSGEKIELSDLSKEEQNHIGLIENLIASSTDYFEVYRQAFVPLKEGKSFNVKSLRELHDSPRYKIISDLVGQYWEKLFLKK